MTKEDAYLVIINKNCKHMFCGDCIGKETFSKHGLFCSKITEQIIIKRFFKGENFTTKITEEEKFQAREKLGYPHIHTYI